MKNTKELMNLQDSMEKLQLDLKGLYMLIESIDFQKLSSYYDYQFGIDLLADSIKKLYNNADSCVNKLNDICKQN